MLRPAGFDIKNSLARIQSKFRCSHVDRSALVQYCASWSLWRKAMVEVESDGVTIEGRDRTTVRHPALVIIKQTGDVMMKFATEFGMTASSRARIEVPYETPEDDSLDKLIQANKAAFKG